jgi:hypothetical protein
MLTFYAFEVAPGQKCIAAIASQLRTVCIADKSYKGDKVFHFYTAKRKVGLTKYSLATQGI